MLKDFMQFLCNSKQFPELCKQNKFRCNKDKNAQNSLTRKTILKTLNNIIKQK